MVIGCKKENATPKVSGNKPFFDFDEVVHYSNSMSQNEADVFVMKDNKSKDEEIKAKILTSDNYPESISDTSFINNLSRLDFVKAEMPKTKLAALHNLFREKEIKDKTEMACEPIYNNILLFKKNNKVTGITKICFGCGQYEIKGTTVNTESFGQGDDFGKLRDILYSQ